MLQVEISLGRTMPATLLCLSNGQVVLLKNQFFRPTFDQHREVSALFLGDGFAMFDASGNEAEFSYGLAIDYKAHPLLLKWLQQQELQSPF